MKKLTSFFIVICIVLSTSVPFYSYAADVNGDQGMYKVNEKVYADAYMLISLDDESYPVIAQKNKDKKKYPASLTKIVTVIVSINNCDNLQKKTVVSKRAIDSLSGTGAQVAGLKPGDVLTVEQLIYLSMVHSARSLRVRRLSGNRRSCQRRRSVVCKADERLVQVSRLY